MQINRKKLLFYAFVKNNIRAFCVINNKNGDKKPSAYQQQKELIMMEKVCSVICFIAGTVFLVMALFGAWRYYFTMGLCYAVGVMIYEDDRKLRKFKKRR